MKCQAAFEPLGGDIYCSHSLTALNKNNEMTKKHGSFKDNVFTNDASFSVSAELICSVVLVIR